MTAKKSAYVLFYGSIFLLLIILIESERAADAARAALLLCARSLIPALIVPLVLSGILSSLSADIYLPGGKLFTRLFHLPSQGLSPFLLGALCGFPVGAKVTAELFEAGAFDKEDAARIAALSANTGPAFAVAGVGGAFFKSIRIGWMLYFVQIFSAMLLGIFDARRHPKASNTAKNANNTAHFCLPDILYRSSLSLLTISGTVAFFGTLCGLLLCFLPTSTGAVIASFLEVGNGTYFASRLPRTIGIPLAAFAISFSGTSVLLQNASHLLPQRIPLTPLVYRKLLHGGLSMLMMLPFLPILQ